jgi:plasmid stabilization system protein ParE
MPPKIIYNPKFTANFNEIWSYIAKDSVYKANNFKQQLKSKIEDIIHFPYKFRQSLHYSYESIRDFIFKGYTIPYMIDEDENCIIILDIFKWTK